MVATLSFLPLSRSTILTTSGTYRREFMYRFQCYRVAYPGHKVIEHLLDIADRRQILAEILDRMSNLILHSERLDA